MCTLGDETGVGGAGLGGAGLGGGGLDGLDLGSSKAAQP